MTKGTMNWRIFLPRLSNTQLLCIIGSCVTIYALRKYQKCKVITGPTVMDKYATITRHAFEISGLNSNDYELWLKFPCKSESTHKYYEECQDLTNGNVVTHSTVNDFNAFVKCFFEQDTQFIKNYKTELKTLLDELFTFEGTKRLGLVKFIYSNNNFVTRFVYIYRRYKIIGAINNKNEFSETCNIFLELQKYLREYHSCTEKETLKLSKEPNDTEILNLPTIPKGSERNVLKNQHLEILKTSTRKHLSIELLQWSNYKVRMQEEFQYKDQSMCAEAIEFLRICYDIFELIQNFINEAVTEFASKEKIN